MRVFLLTMLAALGIVLAWYCEDKVPEQWHPYAPFNVQDPPNWLTRFKLARASGDPALCAQALTTSALKFVPLSDRVTGPGCGFKHAVRVERTSAQLAEPLSLSCATALALAMWEHHVLQPAAIRYFGAPVTRIEHFGSYACRNLYSRGSGPRSQHATANALDLAGFVINDKRRIRVLKDWSSADVESLFLRDIHRGACPYFNAALGPDYNNAHADHFHFDRGPYRICR